MAIHIAICDDSAADREYVSRMVQRWSAQAGAAVKVGEYTGAENFLFRSEDGERTDILLLDIEMGAMDGVTLAKKLRRDNETMQIVFITGYSDYIAEGYEVSALHYLMKRANNADLTNPETVQSLLPWNAASECGIKLFYDPAGANQNSLPAGFLRHAVWFYASS